MDMYFFFISVVVLCLIMLRLITSEAMVQPKLFPCAGCNLYMNHDYRCSGCIEQFTGSVLRGVLRKMKEKGAHFNCLNYWRGLTLPAAKKPSPSHKKKSKMFHHLINKKLDASSSQQKKSANLSSQKKET